MNVAFVIGIITPYTHRLFERLGERLDGKLHVLACGDSEPGRHWSFGSATRYRRTVMGGLRLHRSYVSHVYLNPGIVPALVRGRYDVIVINDFSPTMLVAAAYARLTGTPLIVATDGQPDTDPGTHSLLHRLARRLVVPGAALGLGASRGSLRLLEQYGLPETAGIISPITPGWDFSGTPRSYEERPYDLLFCGHLDDDRKGVLFFADVVDRLVAGGLRPRIRVAGDGPERETLAARLSGAGVEAHFDGYLAQAALAEAYGSSKLFLFPSRGDPWGIVANEAIQCGTPLLVSPHAQAAHELVGPTGTGRILDLDVQAWAEAARHFLSDRDAWEAAHRRTRDVARTFSLDVMTDRVLEAFARTARRPPVMPPVPSL